VLVLIGQMMNLHVLVPMDEIHLVMMEISPIIASLMLKRMPRNNACRTPPALDMGIVHVDIISWQEPYLYLIVAVQISH